MIAEIELELFADYFQFYLQDENTEVDASDLWNDEEVNKLLVVRQGFIYVGTLRNMDVPVVVRIYEAEPSILTEHNDSIDQIMECDLKVTSGKIVIAGCTDYFPEAKRIELLNGIYRTRIYYKNLNSVSGNGLDGDDSYELHFWKTDKNENLKIVKERE